jgi:Flp pilus assembly protein TadG
VGPVRVANRRRCRERGAAAVEFALVLPILLVLLVGIINYGMMFNDSNNLRQGTREAARRAVVGDFDGSSCTTGCNAKLISMTKSAIGATSSQTYVAIKAPSSWAKGNQLTVCALIKPASITNVVPMPGRMSAVTTFSIEVDSTVPDISTYAETPPSGVSWPTGCT